MLFLLIVGFVILYMLGLTIYYAHAASKVPKSKMPRKKDTYF